MAREVKIPTNELGEVKLYAIWETQGKWEFEWESLRGTPVGALFSQAPQEAFTLALGGWARPLALCLGLPPAAALRKLPKPLWECVHRKQCPIFDKKRCFPTAKDMPWCFEPEVGDVSQRLAIAKAVELWREEVYVLVITEDHG